MNFDDFNYDPFNKYILIDPKRDETDENKEDLGTFVPMPVKISQGKPSKKSDINDDQQSLPMTEKELDQACTEGYTHDLLDVQTDQEKEVAK